MTSATLARGAWVEEWVHEHCFGGGSSADGASLTFGAELEWLALDAQDHAVTRIAGVEGAPCSIDVVRDVAARLSWCETISDKGVPRFESVAGGALTFEPGGQLEYASAVHRSIDALDAELFHVERILRDCAEGHDVRLLSRGIDPFNGADKAPLQLTAKRYRSMADYFATIGPAGARMMRQTASLQVNVGGISAIERFSVANAIAPYLVALFANSTHYAGSDTGCASYRAATWRHVDPTRTGLLAGDDPVREYAAFALGARAFLADDDAPPFGALDTDHGTDVALATHLTTLFPEVRPRRYLELRSLDAMAGSSRTAALAFIAGILGDSSAANDALALTGAADDELLHRAGRAGVREPRIAARASDLVAIAVAGCTRLGEELVSPRVRAELECCRSATGRSTPDSTTEAR